MIELSPEETTLVSGGFLKDWAIGEALTRTLEYIYDSAKSSERGNSDMSSWNIA